MTPTTESSETTNPFLVRTVKPLSGTPPVVEETKAPLDDHVDSGKGEVPIELYEEHRGRPFIVDVLDMTGVYPKSGYEAELKMIDEYIQQTITADGLKPSQDSYRAIVAKLDGLLGNDPNLNYDKRVERLAAYAKMLADERALQLRKQLILGTSHVG